MTAPSMPIKAPFGIQFDLIENLAGIRYDATHGVQVYDDVNGTVNFAEAVVALGEVPEDIDDTITIATWLNTNSLLISASAAAEVAHTIAVTVTCTDILGAAASGTVEARLVKKSDGSLIAADDGTITVSDGTADTTDVQPWVIASTGVDGDLTLTVDDVGDAGLDMFLVLTPVNKMGPTKYVLLNF